MKIERVFKFEVTEEERQTLMKAIDIINVSELSSIRMNGGSQLTERIYAAIELLEEIANN